ncbi:MAG: tyrosine--tRNA ligase [Cytophagales bacterium]|nr:tyrosine--tRNA ligase [Armatimonadota bacterium]
MSSPTPTVSPVSSPEIDAQAARLARGAQLIVPEEGLKAKLAKSARTGRPLIVKLGLDPTAPDIHLGFAVVLRKLRQFQDLGHTVVLIIGDYTALIGDPSGRSATRPMLTKEEIATNAATYVDQLARILDKEKTVVRFNGEWLGKMDFAEVVRLTSHMTVAQVLTREDFANRFEAHQPISLHELLYPLAQAQDSVAIESDIEMGGLDQTFNILAGRDLQGAVGQDPQIGFFMPLLVGLDGTKKMSKSLGNYVGISEPPAEMYGKVMSLPDAPMRDWFMLCTDVSEEEIGRLIGEAESGATNPKLVKQRLAREIVGIYHGAAAADAAEDAFSRLFSQHQVPDEIPDVVVPADQVEDGTIGIVALVRLAGFAATNSEARRLVEQGGVSLDGEKVTDGTGRIPLTDGTVLRVGKRHFARVKG